MHAADTPAGDRPGSAGPVPPGPGQRPLTRVLFLDVDGTLTDGSIILGIADDIRAFHAHDGVGIRLALLAGIRVVFMSARESAPVRRRALELGADPMLAVGDKDRAVREWCERHGVTPAQAAFVGDDLQDIPGMKAVAHAFAVGDAVDEVKAVATHVCTRAGGRGAVREAIVWLLRAEGRYEATLEAFLARRDFVIKEAR